MASTGIQEGSALDWHPQPGALHSTLRPGV